MMILLDTNILVFAHNADSPHNKKSSEIIKSAMEFEFNACISHQNLLEFFSVVTSTKHVEKPISP